MQRDIAIVMRMIRNKQLFPIYLHAKHCCFGHCEAVAAVSKSTPQHGVCLFHKKSSVGRATQRFSQADVSGGLFASAFPQARPRISSQTPHAPAGCFIGRRRSLTTRFSKVQVSLIDCFLYDCSTTSSHVVALAAGHLQYGKVRTATAWRRRHGKFIIVRHDGEGLATTTAMR